MTDQFLYVPEAGESLDAFIRDAAQAAAQDAVATHTVLTTDAHGGIVAATDSRLSDARAPTAHKATHASVGADALTPADIGAMSASLRGAANGVAPTDASNLIPEQHIPAVAITDAFEAASETGMLALTAQRGDVAIRSDLSRSFILRAAPASTLSNWSELRTPTDAVLSVDSRTGAVSLADLYAALVHKSRHAAGGVDALSPADIQALGRVYDEGTIADYSSELDFRGEGVIVSRDATTGRIFVTISGAAAGAATEASAGITKVSAAPATAGDPVALGRNDPSLAALIEGLKAVWNSATSVGVESGSAWIPALNRVLEVPSAVTKSSLVLTASTWYYLYLHDNAGTPAVEVSTTAPAVPYRGSARVKGGPDNTRRYLGAVRTDGSGNVIPFASSGGAAVNVSYQADIEGILRVLSGGGATAVTNVSAAGLVPAHARSVGLHLYASANGQSTTATVFVGTPSFPKQTYGQVFSGNAFLSIHEADIAFEAASPQTVSYHWTGASRLLTVGVTGYGEER